MPYISSIIVSTDPSLCIYQDVKELRPFVIEIARLIRRLCDGTISSHDLNRLIQMSAYMAATRTGSLAYRIQAASKSADCTKEELALSLLGEIFSPERRDRYLKKTVCWDYYKPDGELYLTYARVIYREAFHQLFQRWAEHDPMAPKLYRNYRAALRRDNRFRPFPHDAPRWLTLADIGDLREKMPLCRREEMSHILQYVIFQQKSLADIVEALLREIDSDKSRAPVVAIDEVFDLLLKCIKERQETTLTEFSEDLYFKIEADRVGRTALEEAKGIIDSWKSKGLLTEQLAETFQKALGDFVVDMISYCDTMYYWQYLAPYLGDGLNGKVYRENYRQFDTLAFRVCQQYYAYFGKLQEK